METSNFDPSVSGINYQRSWVHIFGKTTDEALVAEYVATLAGKLEGYERILAKQKYLAGEELTIADLFHVPFGTKLEPLGITFLTDDKKYPNVVR